MARQPAEGSARATPKGATGKSDRAFRTISEVSAELDLPQHVLRFWETRFSQIKPMKRNGGRRLYRPDHIALLRGIKALLYDDGMTIKGVQKILREHGARAVVARGEAGAGMRLAEAPAVVPADVTRRLTALRERLEAHLGDAGSAPGAARSETARNGGGEAGPARGAPEARDAEPAPGEFDASHVRESIARLEALLAQLEAK